MGDKHPTIDLEFGRSLWDKLDVFRLEAEAYEAAGEVLEAGDGGEEA